MAGKSSLRIVGTVGKDNIDVRLLEALKGALETLNQVLLGATTGVRLLASSAEEDLNEAMSAFVCVEELCTRLRAYLCGQYVLITGPVELLQCVTHLNLRLAIGVGLGCVKSLDLCTVSMVFSRSLCLKIEGISPHTPLSQAACKHSLTMLPF